MIKISKEELDFFEKEYLKRVTNEFNDIKRMRNSELRKYIENSNWSNILQIIRFLQDEIERLEKEHNILTEFEKWLKKRMKFYEINVQGHSYERHKKIYDKLQQIKKKIKDKGGKDE